MEDEEDEIFYTREDAENQVGNRKKKRKKEKDICFLDMPTSSESEQEMEEEELIQVTNTVDDQVAAVAVRPKKPRAKKTPKPKTEKPKKTTAAGRSRGRGRGRVGRGGRGGRGRGRGLMRVDMDRTYDYDDDDEETTVTITHNHPTDRDGDLLWTEYGQETAGYLSDYDGDNTDDYDTMSSSDDADVSDNEWSDAMSPDGRQMPLFRDDITDQVWTDIQQNQMDFGPCEITSFSKSGRPRKRNMRFCDDEFETFTPGIPPAPKVNKTSQGIFNIVVETPKVPKSQRAPSIKLNQKKYTNQVPKPAEARNVFSTLSMLHERTASPTQPVPQRIPLPITLVKTTTTAAGQPRQSLNLVRVAPGSGSIRNPNPNSVFIQQRAPLQQIRIVTTGSVTGRSTLLSANRPQILKQTPVFNPVTVTHQQATGATNGSNTGGHASSLFESLQGEFNNPADDDDLITLDLEPVNDETAEEQFLAPENDEERNVFESFESLLDL